MTKNQKQIDKLKLDAQVAVDEFNKIQEKIKELEAVQKENQMKIFNLVIARDALKLKAYSCADKIKELKSPEPNESKKEIGEAINSIQVVN